MSRIDTKNEQSTCLTYCSTDVYTSKKCLEIIYIILSNELSNYRNRKNTPKFGGFGVFFLELQTTGLIKFNITKNLKQWKS